MVFRGHHRAQRLAVRKCQHGNLRAGQKFLHNNVVAGSAEHLVFHNGVHGILRLVKVLRDDNALAKRQAVCLNDNRELTALFHVLYDLFRVGEHRVIRCRNTVFLHQIFREHLAALDDGRVRARAECTDALFFERIYHTGRKRVVRRNKHKVNCVFLREIHNAVNVHRVNGHALGVCRNAAVARCAPQLFRFRALFQLADDCMLTSACR